MRPCELRDTADVEMYFYDEFDPIDRARVETHLRGCESCRQRLEDLHAIRHALASRPAIDAPPAGDWSGFMRRLDSAVATVGAVREPPITVREPSITVHPPLTKSPDQWNLKAVFALAALLALVTIGVLVAMRFKPAEPTSVAVKTPVTEPVTANSSPGPGSTLVTSQPRSPQADRALREGSAEHLERSKLVVLGLATRDPRAARAQDWQYERTLAGTLLSETRLYRQAAIQEGASDVARVMRDLETVLLEASMSDRKDRAALQRVQRLIDKRDLVVKMQVMAAAGHAGN
jgi:hypothetical protein